MVGEKPPQSGEYTFDTVTAELLMKSVSSSVITPPSLENSEKQWGYDPRGIFSFKTREGSVGVLEILDAKPDKVKLRYKLVKPAPPKPMNVSVAFAPVIEREVDGAIDFDSGKVIAEPEKFSESNDIAENVLKAVAWLEREGMDAITEPSRSLKGVGIKAKAVDGDAWDKLTPEQVIATLEMTKRETWPDLDPRHGDEPRKTPATWVFETREGGKGILQVLEQTKAGVNVRYKLVQGVAKPSATSASAQRSVFGLQAERMITTRDANRDGVVAFRFKDNLPFQPPDTLTGHFQKPETVGFTPELKQWMLDEKVDLLLHLGAKGYTVLSLDLRDGTAGQPTEWDFIKPEKAAPLLGGLEKLNSNPGPRVAGVSGYHDGLLDVRVFRTWDGQVGFYQLRGLDDADGRGVVIRYRLVLTANATASSGAPKTLDGRAVLDLFEAMGSAERTFGGFLERKDTAGALAWFDQTMKPQADQLVALLVGTELEKRTQTTVARMSVLRAALEEQDWDAVAALFSGNPDRTYEADLRRLAGAKANSSATEAKPAFGPVVNGLQAALELRAADGGDYTLGRPIEVRFHIRNVSKGNIYVAGESWRQDDSAGLTITDEKGQKLRTSSIFYTGVDPVQRVLLKPGDTTVFHSGGLEFLPENVDSPEAGHPVVHCVNAKPGRYTVSFRLRFPDVDRGPKESDDWKGVLETAPVTIQVKAAGTGSGSKPSAKAAPTFEAVTDAAKKLIAKYFPDAVITSSADEFKATYATREHQIHGGSKTGEVAQDAKKQIGPSPKGFILAVRRQNEIGQAELPQLFDRPYWKTYGNQAIDPKTGLGVAAYFDFGSGLNAEFKAAMMELLKFAGSETKPAAVGTFSEKTQKIVDALLSHVGHLAINLEHSPQEQANRHSLSLCAKDRPSPNFYLLPPVTGEQMKKLLLCLAADGYFDRASGGSIPPKSSEMPPLPAKKQPGYLLQVFTPNNPDATHYFFSEDLSQQEGAASVAARKLRSVLEGEALQAVDTILNEIAEQAAIKITREQVAQVEALLKKGPVTENRLAEIWEHDETSGSSYRQRADVVAIPILPAEKSPLDIIPLGEVLHQISDTTFYIQWDAMGSSTHHYYGPYHDFDEITKVLGLKLTNGGKAPKPASNPPTSSDGESSDRSELEGQKLVEVKDPATQAVAPVADAIWSSYLGKPVEITVNDVQTTRENCALSLDTGKLLAFTRAEP